MASNDWTCQLRWANKKRLFGGKPAMVVASQPDGTTYPEFHRLAYLLRQAVETQSVSVAVLHFGRLEQLGTSGGLNDKTLVNFTKRLAANKKWQEAIRPLTLAIRIMARKQTWRGSG